MNELAVQNSVSSNEPPHSEPDSGIDSPEEDANDKHQDVCNDDDIGGLVSRMETVELDARLHVDVEQDAGCSEWTGTTVLS